MGIRKIEDEIDLKEAMKKKAAELKIKEIKAKASVENLTKDRLKELAKRHGVILALNPKLKGEVKLLQERYNIPSSKIIEEQIYESDVLIKSKKLDLEKLGMLAYQRVLMRKEETGGIMPISEVFELINTGILKGNVEIKDLIKAMRILKKTSILDKLNNYLKPGLRFLGMSKNAAILPIIGMTLGLAYGGGLIVKEAKSKLISKKDVFLSIMPHRKFLFHILK